MYIEEEEEATEEDALAYTLNEEDDADQVDQDVRMAIRKHPELSRILTTLSKYAATVKHSLNHIQGHINNKAKLFIDNKTRWFSSYLMLLTF